VLYVEPESAPARRLIGYDLASDPVRRAALERARDSAQPSASAPVTIESEGASGTQPGFLMFLPVYRSGAPVDSVAERRDALRGYVYGAFRIADTVSDIPAPGLDLRISDTRVERASALLFDSAQGTAAPRGAEPQFVRAETIAIAGRAWRMEVTSRPAFEAAIDRERPHLTLVVGLFLVAFLAAALWSLLTQHRDARRLATRMTRALRESEQRLSLALESSGLALFDWNVDSGLVHLSKEWEMMLGAAQRPTQVLASALQERVHPEDAERVLAEVRALLRGDTQGYKVEHRVRTHAGEWKWIESVARVTARDERGRAHRVTGTNADISARKAIEQMKDEFMATVSHELRTPLTAIVGSLALVRDGETGELPAQAQEFVGMAYENAERLAALVNDIRDLQRLESGRLEFSIAPVEVAPFLERSLALNAAYADRYKVKFALAPVPPGLRVAADDDRLMQVVTNLLSNAAKFSPAGAEVRIAAAAAGPMVRISVADRGRGIPLEFRARVFTRFALAESSDSRQRGGTGPASPSQVAGRAQ
jgi:PAS domain S-box-containing protein